jgi:hypothetical protein
LTTARAHISALEAKLQASVEAWESANATKVSVEKATKSAETMAKKAKKALAEAQKKQAKWEQSVAERLDKISVSVGSKCRITVFLDTYLGFHLLICVYSFCLCLCGTAKKIGESWRLRQPNFEDPLLAVVDVLESNWRLVQNILQRVRHVLIHLFPELFPKKKNEIPADNLQRLVESFDTIEDPVSTMKLISIKRGVEGEIALAQAHGGSGGLGESWLFLCSPPFEDVGFLQEGKAVCTQHCDSYFSVGSFFDLCAWVFGASFQHPCC